MNCIIIDDEAAARAIVAQLCSKIPELDVIEQFDNAIEAIKFLNQQNIDVVFLDIHMPGFSGVDFVQTLKNPPKIVLTTCDTNFAIEAYEYESIVDYLVKPITLERFQKSIQKIKNISQQSPVGPSKEAGETASGEDLYINIDRRLIKLKKIKEKLPEKVFMQIHRSFIINFNKIIDIEDNSVLIGKNVIPISRSNRPELMRRLNLL